MKILEHENISKRLKNIKRQLKWFILMVIIFALYTKLTGILLNQSEYLTETPAGNLITLLIIIVVVFPITLLSVESLMSYLDKRRG